MENYAWNFKRCPYNQSHYVDPIRFAKHIQKCRKANPQVQLEICPHNAVHHVPKHQFHAHIRECKEKNELYFVPKAASSPKCDRISPLGASALHKDCGSGVASELSAVCKEDWEAEAAVEERSRVDPKLAVLFTTFIRVPDASLGLGKAGRKEWNRVDALRINRILKKLPIEDLEYPTADGSIVTVGEMLHGPKLSSSDVSVRAASAEVDDSSVPKPNLKWEDKGSDVKESPEISKKRRRRRKRKYKLKDLSKSNVQNETRETCLV